MIAIAVPGVAARTKLALCIEEIDSDSTPMMQMRNENDRQVLLSLRSAEPFHVLVLALDCLRRTP